MRGGGGVGGSVGALGPDWDANTWDVLCALGRVALMT